jgi:hypothetical protein
MTLFRHSQRQPWAQIHLGSVCLEAINPIVSNTVGELLLLSEKNLLGEVGLRKVTKYVSKVTKYGSKVTKYVSKVTKYVASHEIVSKANYSHELRHKIRQ